MAGIMNPWRVAARALALHKGDDILSLQSSLRWSRHFSTRLSNSSAANGTKKLTTTSSPLQSRFPTQHVATAFARSRRRFSSTPTSQHGDIQPPKPGEELHVTFVTKEGDRHTFEVCEGDNLLDIASHHDLEMEGACEGSCSCSTCHVIVEDEAMFDKMAEADDDENDMLDLAFGLTETSRLGCQVKMSKELDGLVVKLPTMTRNLQASDFVSK